MNSSKLFWLHVPIETTRGNWFKPPTGRRFSVLGKPARLLDRELPTLNSLTSANTAVIKQWLLFDPMIEGDARNLFEDLRAKIPALAFLQQAAFRIGASDLYIAPYSLYSGPIPTLVPAAFKPNPGWVSAESTSYLDGAHVLGPALDATPSITDIRLITALDLEIASRYDVLPRSIFLAQLTILDSLAVRNHREDPIKEWIDTKIQEAAALNDQGLISSLESLKQGSHGAAVRALVSRAAFAMGANPDEQAANAQLAGKLYGVRSAMSHAGASPIVDVQAARDLVSLVLKASIADLDVLNPVVFGAKQPSCSKPSVEP